MKPFTITGTHIAYSFICKRKLWLFAHGIQAEHESDAVRLGRHIHETTYERETKELDIDGIIVLDHIDAKAGIVHEVKKSDKMEEAHSWQLLYYLWYLKHKGVTAGDGAPLKGELNYPTLRQTSRVELTPEKERELETVILPEIRRVLALPEPPTTVEWKVCKACSYCELCHS
ncbi:MAG: CRISPR-associated protein Cas4 [Ignavibacteria bacterium]|nr:CRISPR-associated protein Cas4 [Ignavibacteria bacterium]